MFPDWHNGLIKILLSVKADSQLPALESFIAKTKSTPVSPMEFTVSESKRSELFQRIQAFAPPDLVPEALYKADKSNQAEVDRILSVSSLTTEDKVTLMTMTIMKKLDQDIERQAQHINFIQQQSHPGRSLDVETMKLKRLIDKRGQMFDMLRQIIDKYNQTAKSIIDSIGR
jgi:hypothetical protein